MRDRLTAAGVPLISQYGVGGYRIDFAAKHPQRPGELVLAIEADGASYHSAKTARDRDRLRQEHLEALGWRFHRIWSTAWFRNPANEVAKAVAAYQDAVTAADRGHASRLDVVSKAPVARPPATGTKSAQAPRGQGDRLPEVEEPKKVNRPSKRSPARVPQPAPARGPVAGPTAATAASNAHVLSPRGFQRINEEVSAIADLLGNVLDHVGADKAGAVALRKGQEKRNDRLKERLDELRGILANARVGDPGKSTGRVTPGSLIHIRYEDGEESNVVISEVGHPDHDHVTPTTGIGQALAAARVGDIRVIETPTGPQRMTVVAILD
ncbi:GreA/GreB family elongation factor [Sphaerisporangium viridialbum]|uniref:GreA/GreB family elongation factor n=1 Tax=Sphaerisporangium viridialbum TaxID=46189 RepID=UPI003C73C500